MVPTDEIELLIFQLSKTSDRAKVMELVTACWNAGWSECESAFRDELSKVAAARTPGQGVGDV